MYAARYLIFLASILGFSVFGYSQHTLRGIVSSDDEMEKSFIEVELADASFKRIDYLILEGENFFEIEVDTSYSIVHLIVSVLGCSPFLQKVDFSENKTVFLAVKLENCTQQLDEVIVSAEQSFIRESGDTLTFDVEGFRTKTDLTLGDLLSRMPGIEISASNQILYQGKRVKQIWVEGRDILNNQHSLAIESLRAEDIEKIQIVHEYKPFHLRFSQGHSADVAMNIGLKRATRGKVNGKAEALGGANQKYQLGAEALRAREKSGESAFIRSNNIGAAVIQPLEYLGMLPDLSSIGGGKSGEVEVVPKALLPDVNAFEETQHLFSAGIDNDIGEKTRVTATILGVWKTAREQANIATQFFDENATFTGQGRGQTRFPMLFFTLQTKYEPSKNLLLAFDMTARFNEQQAADTRAGIFREASYFSEFTSTDRSSHYSPVVSVNMRHPSNWSSGHRTGVDIKDQHLDLAFIEDNGSEPVYGQRLDDQRVNVFLSSFLENKHNIFLLEIKNYLEFGHLRRSIQFDQLPGFDNASSYASNWRNWQPSIRYGIKTDHWLTHLQLELAHNNLDLSDQTFQRTWLNPLFRFKHSWSLVKFIGVSLRQTQAFVDQRNAFNFYQLQDNLQVVSSALEAGQSSRTRQVDFYFFNLQKDKKSSINCTFNYQEKTNALSRFNSFENDFVVSEIFLAPKLQSSTIAMSYSQPFGNKKYQLKTRLRTMLTSIERGALSNVDGRNLSLGTHFSSLWKGQWNADLQGSYNWSEQKQGTINQVWHTWVVGVGLRHKSKKWNGSINYDWQLNRIASASIHLQVLDFRLDYNLDTWLTLSLFGQDLFNLNSSQMLRLTTAPSFVEQAEYRRLEGSLMVGVKGSF
ncbi:MAG: hypothetical protein ACRBG0_21630 [Lewinella sp.]|uniref:hypothetical protein n=1 Tax=Lewinella sp. TaxID=2004506 RepID=UPI003D6C4506